MYLQPQNSCKQTQTAYLQSNTHIPLPQNFNMQGLGNQAAYTQEVPPQTSPPMQVDPWVIGQTLMAPI